MNLFHLLRPVAVLLVAAGIVTFPSRASAEDRPFFLRGTAQFVSQAGDFIGAGNATHMGLYTEIGSAVISGDNPFALQVSGYAILTAANGDELWVEINGQFNAMTGTITATDTYWGGTGRFEDATGSASLVAQAQPDGTFAVVVAGNIDY
jgi:hypothetical protein